MKDSFKTRKRTWDTIIYHAAALSELISTNLNKNTYGEFYS